jgi:hypothetical protein
VTYGTSVDSGAGACGITINEIYRLTDIVARLEFKLLGDLCSFFFSDWGFISTWGLAMAASTSLVDAAAARASNA